MQKHPKVFNDLYVSMVKSGEMGGSLDTTLLKLAAMLERECTCGARSSRR